VAGAALGCGWPGLYAAAAQNRELSGVITSSIRMMRPSPSLPNSNLVSAMMMPWSRPSFSPSE